MRFEIDGFVFPLSKQEEIPSGITTAPITLIGLIFRTKTDAMLVAGLTGTKLIDDAGSRVRPASGG